LQLVSRKRIEATAIYQRAYFAQFNHLR